MMMSCFMDRLRDIYVMFKSYMPTSYFLMKFH